MKTVTPIILIIAGLGLFVLYTDKNYRGNIEPGKNIKELQAQITEYQTAIGKSRQILNKRQELQDQYKQFSAEDLDNIKKLLPDNVDNVQLILDLNGIAKKYGMALKGIKIEDKSGDTGAATQQVGPDRSPTGSIQVTFRVTSTYANFVNFLRDVEKSLRIVDVVSLNFKATEKGTYDYEVAIKTYWLKK